MNTKKQYLLKKMRTESGSSLMLAVLLMIIMLAIVATLTATIIAGTQKSGQTRDYTFHSLAADTALNDALLTANTETLGDGVTSLINYIGPENAKSGVVSPGETSAGDINWRWYALPTPNSNPYTDYQIYASGYRGNDLNGDRAYHLTARLTSFAVSGSSEDPITGVPIYKLPSHSLFSKGAVGVEDVFLSQEASVHRYNSAGGTTPPNAGTGAPTGGVHTNGKVNIDGGYGGYLKEANLYGVQIGDNPQDRCEGECVIALNSHSYFFDSVDYDKDSSISRDPEVGAHTCSSYEDWTASENNGKLNPGSDNTLCFNNLTIDENTDYPTSFSTGSPLVIFVNGNLNISPGKSLRSAAWQNPARGPLSLRIVVDGDVNIAGHPTLTTELSGLLIATNGGTCTVGSDNTKAEVRGAIACSTLHLGGKSVIWVDEQTKSSEVEEGPGGIDGTDTRAWSYSGYEIINSLP